MFPGILISKHLEFVTRCVLARKTTDAVEVQ